MYNNENYEKLYAKNKVYMRGYESQENTFAVSHPKLLYKHITQRSKHK